MYMYIAIYRMIKMQYVACTILALKYMFKYLHPNSCFNDRVVCDSSTKIPLPSKTSFIIIIYQ
jgi:hypothetical protein